MSPAHRVAIATTARLCASRRRGWLPLALAIAMVIAALGLAAPALAVAPPKLSVRSAALVEESTGQMLYGDNQNTRLAMASTTKLMTALLTLEHVHRLGTMFTQNDYYPSSVDSQIGLVPGERMSVHDLLLALMLPSADDAAEDLAYNVGHGSVGRFVGMMDVRARQLGLNDTHYTTPSGLDTPGNYSSAADLVKLAIYDLTHSRYFARVVGSRRATLLTGSHVRDVTNLNTLVQEYRWISGVKTGHTAAAGYVLVASGHRNGMTLVSAVMGTDSEAARDSNSLTLLNWGFANYRLATPVRAGTVLARPTVRYRSGEQAELVASATLTRVIERRSHVQVVVSAPTQLTGPLPRHVEVGTASVLVDGRLVARIPLMLAQALPAASPLTVAASFITRPLTLGVLVLLAAAASALAFALRQRRRARPGDGGLEVG